MSSGSSPRPPDYKGAAQAEAEGNLEAARAAASANRTNQVGPTGSITWSQTPTYTLDAEAYNKAYDSWKRNDPFSFSPDKAPKREDFMRLNPDAGWTQTQSLSPGQQAILNSQSDLNIGLLRGANSGLSGVDRAMADPNVRGYDVQLPGDFSANGPSTGFNPGESYQEAMMRRLAPQMERETAALDNQLANQGVTRGSEAWKEAKDQLGRQHNDLASTATVAGFQTGLAANDQAFRQAQQQYQSGLAGRQLGFNQAAYNKQLPINLINALRNGTQVQAPQQLSTPQQATTQGANLVDAATQGYNARIGAFNAENAQNQQNVNTAAQLGTMAYMLYAMSDRRLKSNIRRIGTLLNGLGWYTYTIHGKASQGVMADEVEAIMPDAVIALPSGFKAVNYSRVLA